MFTIALFVTMAVARAGTTFDGTFMHVARGLVEYFSLTQTGGDVAGFYYSLLADPSAVNGIKETRINVSGVTDGNRVNFREGQGAFSSTLGWIARPSGDGFRLSFPSNGGYLMANQFRTVSPDALNSAIASLRGTIANARAVQAQAQTRAQVQAEFGRLENAVGRGNALRPSIAPRLQRLRSRLQAAQAKLATANDELATANAALDQAEREAEAAGDAAQTADDRQHAADLRQVTADKRQGISDARQRVYDAAQAVRDAQYTLDTANRDVARFNEEMRSWSQALVRDRSYLSRPLRLIKGLVDQGREREAPEL